MLRFLVVIGLQPEKIKAVGKEAERIKEWVMAHHDEYAAIISIVRYKQTRSNFERQGDDIITDGALNLGYYTDQIIRVPGFDVDCTQFRNDVHYDIVGISTAASVLCCAMSMFSAGLDISILSKLCADRKGKKIHEAALTILREYMPIAVK